MNPSSTFNEENNWLPDEPKDFYASDEARRLAIETYRQQLNDPRYIAARLVEQQNGEIDVTSSDESIAKRIEDAITTQYALEEQGLPEDFTFGNALPSEEYEEIKNKVRLQSNELIKREAMRENVPPRFYALKIVLSTHPKLDEYESRYHSSELPRKFLLFMISKEALEEKDQTIQNQLIYSRFSATISYDEQILVTSHYLVHDKNNELQDLYANWKQCYSLIVNNVYKVNPSADESKQISQSISSFIVNNGIEGIVIIDLFIKKILEDSIEFYKKTLKKKAFYSDIQRAIKSKFNWIESLRGFNLVESLASYDELMTGDSSQNKLSGEQVNSLRVPYLTQVRFFPVVSIDRIRSNKAITVDYILSFLKEAQHPYLKVDGQRLEFPFSSITLTKELATKFIPFINILIMMIGEFVLLKVLTTPLPNESTIREVFEKDLTSVLTGFHPITDEKYYFGANDHGGLSKVYDLIKDEDLVLKQKQITLARCIRIILHGKVEDKQVDQQSLLDKRNQRKRMVHNHEMNMEDSGETSGHQLMCREKNIIARSLQDEKNDALFYIDNPIINDDEKDGNIYYKPKQALLELLCSREAMLSSDKKSIQLDEDDDGTIISSFFELAYYKDSIIKPFEQSDYILFFPLQDVSYLITYKELSRKDAYHVVMNEKLLLLLKNNESFYYKLMEHIKVHHTTTSVMSILLLCYFVTIFSMDTYQLFNPSHVTYLLNKIMPTVATESAVAAVSGQDGNKYELLDRLLSTTNIDIVSSLFTLFTIPVEKRDEIISYTKKFIWKHIKETFSFFIIHTVFPCLSLSISNGDVVQNNAQCTIIPTKTKIIAKPWLGIEPRHHLKNHCEECDEKTKVLSVIQFRDDIPVIMHVCENCVSRIHVSI